MEDQNRQDMHKKSKKLRLRPVILGAVLTGYTVFSLLDAFVIPRDIVTVEEVQAAGDAYKSAAGEEPDSQDSGQDAAAENELNAEQNESRDQNQSQDQNQSRDQNQIENNSKNQDAAQNSGKGKGRAGAPEHGKKRHKKRSTEEDAQGADSMDGTKESGNAGSTDAGGSAENAGGADAVSGATASAADSNTADSNTVDSNTADGYTVDSYTADGVSITLKQERVSDTEVYIADIVFDDPSALLSGLANGSFGRNISQKTSEIAESAGAVLAVNGDYYGFRDSGYVMRNGYLYRDTPRSGSGNEDLVVYSDGRMEIIDESQVSAAELQSAGAVQIYSFGPGLIKDGEVTVSPGDEVDQSMNSNPRTAIGMVEPGHYIMVVSDGRTSESAGLSLAELAEVMQEQGCTTAYNLDGGGSSTMWFNGRVVNNPTSGGRNIKERKVSDIVYI